MRYVFVRVAKTIIVMPVSMFTLKILNTIEAIPKIKIEVLLNIKWNRKLNTELMATKKPINTISTSSLIYGL